MSGSAHHSVALFYAAVTGLHRFEYTGGGNELDFAGGFFFDRKVFVLNSLAAAAFFLLCWDTNELFRQAFNSPSQSWAPLYCWPIHLLGFLQRWSAPDPFCHEACCAVRDVGCTLALNGSVAEPAFLSRPGLARCH